MLQVMDYLLPLLLVWSPGMPGSQATPSASTLATMTSPLVPLSALLPRHSDEHNAKDNSINTEENLKAVKEHVTLNDEERSQEQHRSEPPRMDAPHGSSARRFPVDVRQLTDRMMALGGTRTPSVKGRVVRDGGQRRRRKKRRRRRGRRKEDNKTRRLPGERYARDNRTFNSPTKKTLDADPPNRGGVGWTGGQHSSLDPQRAKVRRHIMVQHNVLRSQVQPPATDMLALTWYETAAEQAQAWAAQCGQGEQETSVGSVHGPTDHPSVRWTSRYGVCGQNVLVTRTKMRWSQVLGRWWGGHRHFRYGWRDNNSSLVSAYTQMAWYSSHQLGCGFARCSSPGGGTFFRYVCNYCPAGNDPGRLGRPYTAGEQCGACRGACRTWCGGPQRRPCRLCTNACHYSDLWLNCPALHTHWHSWLCNTKTVQGVERFKNCRATCQCLDHIT